MVGDRKECRLSIILPLSIHLHLSLSSPIDNRSVSCFLRPEEKKTTSRARCGHCAALLICCIQALRLFIAMQVLFSLFLRSPLSSCPALPCPVLHCPVPFPVPFLVPFLFLLLFVASSHPPPRVEAPMACLCFFYPRVLPWKDSLFAHCS